ncbi:MAG: hypothetical protein ACREFO_20955, partial [Acetobacteraceae bacterium]
MVGTSTTKGTHQGTQVGSDTGKVIGALIAAPYTRREATMVKRRPGRDAGPSTGKGAMNGADDPAGNAEVIAVFAVLKGAGGSDVTINPDHKGQGLPKVVSRVVLKLGWRRLRFRQGADFRRRDQEALRRVLHRGLAS